MVSVVSLLTYVGLVAHYSFYMASPWYNVNYRHKALCTNRNQWRILFSIAPHEFFGMRHARVYFLLFIYFYFNCFLMQARPALMVCGQLVSTARKSIRTTYNYN